MRTDPDPRLLRLEELAAHQARVIEDLSDQLARQWETIDRLTAKLNRLGERFGALEEQSGEAPPITRPPHY